MSKTPPDAAQALMTPPPTERGAFIDASATAGKLFASPRYYDATKARDRAGRSYDRSLYPEGAARQVGTIFASGSRADGLRAPATASAVFEAGPGGPHQFDGR